MKNKDPEGSLNYWAEMTGLDRRTLQKRLTAAGVLKAKKYKLSDVLRAALSQYGAARTRIAEATAERCEFENKKRRGEMLDAAEVREAVASGVAMFFSETERLFVNELPPVAGKPRCRDHPGAQRTGRVRRQNRCAGEAGKVPEVNGRHQIAGSGFGFDDNGAVVAVQMPAEDAALDVESGEQFLESSEAVRRVLDFLIGDQMDPKSIGRNVIFFAFALRTPRAPRTQKELADRLGISEAAVRQALSRFRARTRDFIGCKPR